MKRFITAVFVLVTVLSTAAIAGAATRNGSDSTSPRATVDTSSAIVQLKGDPIAAAAKTRPARGKKIDFDSTTVKNYRAQLAALRNDFKSWLRANAPAAKVNGEFDVALNAVSVELNGTSLDTLRSSPLVVSAQLQGLYTMTGADPDLAIIDAIEAWGGAGGSATAGEGVKVAIIDSGIDKNHPCFADSNPRNDGAYTNDKVIDAAVYYMRNGVAGWTPDDENGHGTHVAGTVACAYDTPAVVNGVEIPYGVSGVAPAAKLGNFNVFPGTVESARSEDIMNALEDALEKGYDVANMSLGGGSSGVQDLLSMAVDNADIGNMVVAVSQGNDGPARMTGGSPGIAPRALTAGASTVPHFVGATFSAGSVTAGAAVGDFATVTANLSAPLGVVKVNSTTMSNACTAGVTGAHGAPAAGSLNGMIAVVSRGACTFSEKIRNAQNAGAVAAIVVNNVAGDPTAMGLGGIANEPTIPAYMVGLQFRSALLALPASTTASITKSMAYFLTTNVDIRAGFSAGGPTDVDFRVKPDVMAPGVNVLSAQPEAVCGKNCWAFYQGTSMASPHLAGTAAFLRGKHPEWSAAEVRSAIVNTAETGVVTAHTNGTTKLSNPVFVGSGRENVVNANGAAVGLAPVSVTFGAMPSGAGQAKTVTVELSTLDGGASSYGAAITGKTYQSWSSSATEVAEPRGVTFRATWVDADTLAVTVDLAKGASAGDHWATLEIKRGNATVAHAAVYVLVK